MTDVAPLVPASTVVLARDAADGVEVLMLRRNSKLAFGGMWVFPGGRVDDPDRASGDHEVDWARAAAVREAHEETGLEVDASSLIAFSHWIPPEIAPRRFSTWFFLARAPRGDVVVDMGEIHEHMWTRPGDAIARRDAGEIELVPPTWVTLHWLATFTTVDQAQRSVLQPEVYATRVGRLDGTPVVMWGRDSAYESGELGRGGPRHRLVMGDVWNYERSH